NETFSIIKNGTQTSRITLPLIGRHRTFLLLKKQRFFCKNCSCIFIAESAIVDRHCFISKQTKSLVTMKAAEAQSLTLIAQDTSVSISTIQRFIHQYSSALTGYQKTFRLMNLNTQKDVWHSNILMQK
ncbi:MAG: transposase, partial [Kurthia sp.]|nr:transposase [Candidatus Kurthia equi]